ncbi:MAG: hypothetical protein NZM12_01765, partial [Steroidobacteraceae bacterium]|nr:hypothetical protein [Steroidobacteraceae bacterium]MDW8259064.1 hypothetical protein [Gammaproteobacteria bacterium]
MKSMRALALLLLLANLVMLVGSRWLGGSTPASSHSLPATLPRLALASEVPPPPKRCVSIGPFAGDAELAAASQVLREVGYRPRPREVLERFQTGYAVIVEDLETSVQLAQTMRRLERAGIRDAVLMSEEGPGMRLAVGVFAERGPASRRQQAVRELGIDAKVIDRLATRNVWWLDIDLRTTGEELDPASLTSGGES